MRVKGLRLEQKTPFQRLQIKIITDIVFAILHQMDLRIKKVLLNYNKEKKPAIYAMWHGTQWGLGLFSPEERKHINVLVSPSNDGELIARICHLLGFSLIRGSHGREGEKATREMVTALKNGENIAFMVDGPKGPKQKVKKGLIKLAKIAQVPIIPIMPYMKNKKSFNSWDDYQVPWTFWIKATMIFGEPVYIPENISEVQENELKLKLENIFIELEKEVLLKHKEHWGEN